MTRILTDNRFANRIAGGERQSVADESNGPDPAKLRANLGQDNARADRSTRRPAIKIADPIGPIDGIVGRAATLVVVVSCIALVLVWRMVHLQVLHPERYVDYGLDQRLRRVELPAGRGDILDRNGDQLATSLPRQTFFTDPGFVTDAAAGAQALAPVLGMPAADVEALLTADGSFAFLARQVDDQTAAEIEALAVDGVFSREEPARFNPAGDRLAAALVGRVGIDNQGLSGLEFAFDDMLRGVAGETVLERDQQGNTIPNGVREVVAASPGSDVVTTIDRALQFEVERLLMGQVDAMGAKGGVVVVTDPRSGEILAMASVGRDETRRIIVSPENAAATWAFEPGSVMKAVTFAAVLDSGTATPDTSILVPDRVDVYDRVFSDHDAHDDEVMTVREVVAASSNVGTVKWAQALGSDAFDAALRDLGFGESPGLGLPGETAGLMLDRDDWDGTTLAASALGQSIAVSPVQMIAAYNAIANDGEFVPLRLVEEVVDPEGNRTIFRDRSTRQVLSPAAAAEMRSILTSVVTIGTGTAAAVDGYEVAGKTGTARKPLATGGYQDAAGNYRYVSSFVGFLPAQNPQLSIMVAIDEPTTSIYASVAAAPTFADIARYALRHYQIPPTPDLEVSAAGIFGASDAFVPFAPDDHRYRTPGN